MLKRRSQKSQHQKNSTDVRGQNLSMKTTPQMCEAVEQKIQKLDGNSATIVRGLSRQASEAAKNAVEALKLRHKDITLDFYRVCEERNRAAMAMQKQRDQYSMRPPTRAIIMSRINPTPPLSSHVFPFRGTDPGDGFVLVLNKVSSIHDTTTLGGRCRWRANKVEIRFKVIRRIRGSRRSSWSSCNTSFGAQVRDSSKVDSSRWRRNPPLINPQALPASNAQ